MADQPVRETDKLPPKGYASPLEGELGSEIAGFLGFASLAIGSTMALRFGHNLTNTLAQQGPLLAQSSLQGATPLMKPIELQMPAPKPPSMIG